VFFLCLPPPLKNRYYCAPLGPSLSPSFAPFFSSFTSSSSSSPRQEEFFTSPLSLICRIFQPFPPFTLFFRWIAKTQFPPSSSPLKNLSQPKNRWFLLPSWFDCIWFSLKYYNYASTPPFRLLLVYRGGLFSLTSYAPPGRPKVLAGSPTQDPSNSLLPF